MLPTLLLFLLVANFYHSDGIRSNQEVVTSVLAAEEAKDDGSSIKLQHAKTFDSHTSDEGHVDFCLLCKKNGCTAGQCVECTITCPYGVVRKPTNNLPPW